MQWSRLRIQGNHHDMIERKTMQLDEGCYTKDYIIQNVVAWVKVNVYVAQLERLIIFVAMIKIGRCELDILTKWCPQFVPCQQSKKDRLMKHLTL